MVLPTFSRKKLFVSSGIQGTMVLRFAFYWAVYHFAIWHAAFIYFFIRERIGQLTGQSQVRSIDQLYAHFWTEYMPLMVAACLMLPIVMYEIIRQTHRIAGPLVRFSHTIRDMMTGQEVRPVKLREGDLLTDFEKLFNEFIAFYQAKKQSAATVSESSSVDELLDLPQTAVESCASSEPVHCVASNAD